MTWLWLIFSTGLGYAIGLHLEHPYWGLTIGFFSGLLLRFAPKIFMEIGDILADIF